MKRCCQGLHDGNWPREDAQAQQNLAPPFRPLLKNVKNTHEGCTEKWNESQPGPSPKRQRRDQSDRQRKCKEGTRHECRIRSPGKCLLACSATHEARRRAGPRRLREGRHLPGRGPTRLPPPRRVQPHLLVISQTAQRVTQNIVGPVDLGHSHRSRRARDIGMPSSDQSPVSDGDFLRGSTGGDPQSVVMAGHDFVCSRLFYDYHPQQPVLRCQLPLLSPTWAASRGACLHASSSEPSGPRWPLLAI